MSLAQIAKLALGKVKELLENNVEIARQSFKDLEDRKSSAYIKAAREFREKRWADAKKRSFGGGRKKKTVTKKKKKAT